MSKRRELPADPLGIRHHEGDEDWEVQVLDSTLHIRRPETAVQALMEAAPHSEPLESTEELGELREILCDALDKLTDRARFIVNACVVEQAPLRELARRMSLSKTHVARLRDEAYVELREALGDNPVVLEHFARNHTIGEDNDQ